MNINNKSQFSLYVWVCHKTNMSDKSDKQEIIDLLNPKFSEQEKNLHEIAGQLSGHKEAMVRVEKEMMTRISANTIQLQTTTELAASNLAKVETAGNDIVTLQAENRKMKSENNKMKSEIKELKTSMKQVKDDQLDTKRRSYKK